ncbi:terminase gpP N-terminus-related DNA-binding protein [Shewanella abyssi]|uniref:terminase gpP N-terminus-related DNA-binding protein n=1 Tax=Shewanella abyssi TaxID=311789 RepID=UPI003D1608F7
MSLIELKRRAKTEKRSRTRIRYLAVSLFFKGKSRADIARSLKVARGSVNKWVSNHLDNGISVLVDVVHYARPPRLSPEQLTSLTEFVEKVI